MIPVINKIAGPSLLMYYPFFVIEFKSYKGEFEAAQNQACRAGAAIIYSMRDFRAKAGVLNINDADDHGRMAFSMAMTLIVAKLYVNWAKVGKDGSVQYHMNSLQTFDLDHDDDVPVLRRCIINIFEWGILKRKSYIKGLLAKIAKELSVMSVPEGSEAGREAMEALCGDEDELSHEYEGGSGN